MNPSMRTPAPQASALDVLATESIRPELDDLDRRPTDELVRTLVEGQSAAQSAVMAAVPAITAAADAIAARLKQGGRLFYVGAGTSGRLAILDASECPPTFNTSPEMVVALIAGGPAAVQEAVEGAEDDDEGGAADLRARNLKPNDAVVGITASGRTPYVVGALRYARKVGSHTIAIVNNARSALVDVADTAIELLTGPEVIAGSTRLCAGTAQKIALSTLSTAVMVRLGKTYGPYMVDVRATNAKLRRRALRMVQQITGADSAASTEALAATEGRVKPAVVMLLGGCDADEAERRLDAADGRVREALAPR
ncbi:MAG TPA: N-acetylmuramic acid 6-phosphate etherase [Rhodanobacteraceae bacterium]|nr:N-acetylmuramic acid 6-phosphate etherase [Rhodanobacteraceae bacterium]